MKKYLVTIDSSDGMAHLYNVMVVFAENKEGAIDKASILQGYNVKQYCTVNPLDEINEDWSYFT